MAGAPIWIDRYRGKDVCGAVRLSHIESFEVLKSHWADGVTELGADREWYRTIAVTKNDNHVTVTPFRETKDESLADFKFLMSRIEGVTDGT